MRTSDESVSYIVHHINKNHTKPLQRSATWKKGKKKKKEQLLKIKYKKNKIRSMIL